MTHLCAHCGGRVADEAERCPSCGSPQRVGAPGAPRPRGAPRSRAPVMVIALAAGAFAAIGVVTGALLFVSGGGPPPPAPAPNPDAVRTSATAAGGGLAAVKARGKLRVAADPEAPPFLARTADGWEGFEYGVASALAAEVGVPLEIVPATFSTLPDQLRSGAADLVIGQMSPTGEHADLAWSVSYLQYSLCLVVTSASPVRGLADLRGKRVGMYDDPVATQVTAVGVGADYQRVTFDGYGYFDQLVAGQLDAVVYDCPLARAELVRYGNKLRIADDALNVSTYNVALRADDPALETDVNRVLKSLGDQGLLARLESRWLGAAGRGEGYTTPTGRVVVVRRGDTLRSVAERELGSAERWAELAESNRDLVGDDPDAIYAGLRLRVGSTPVSGTPRRQRPRAAR